jgi:hypothetical protein
MILNNFNYPKIQTNVYYFRKVDTKLIEIIGADGTSLNTGININ